MLSQTKEELQNIINKIQVDDYAISALNVIHKNDKPKADALFNRASHHKVKLLDEALRLNGALEASPEPTAEIFPVIEAEQVK